MKIEPLRPMLHASRRALAARGSAATLTVREATRRAAKLPDGGWPETRQARMQLADAVDAALRNLSDEETWEVVDDLIDAQRAAWAGAR